MAAYFAVRNPEVAGVIMTWDLNSEYSNVQI
jgi:hypothetical protein